MTKIEAKALTLAKYAEFAKLPASRRHTENLPEHLRDRFMRMHNQCALCELFRTSEPPCRGCPLSPHRDCDRYDDGTLATNTLLVERWLTYA